VLHLTRLSTGFDEQGKETVMATGLALCSASVSTKAQAVPITRVDCPECLKKWKGDTNRDSRRFYIVNE